MVGRKWVFEVGWGEVERHRARGCATHARAIHVGWCRGKAVGLMISRRRRVRGCNIRMVVEAQGEASAPSTH